LVPVGYATSPVFFDWVDLKWYNSDKGQPEWFEQLTHDSADQITPLEVDPLKNVTYFQEEYYGIDETTGDLDPYKGALPASVKNMTGVNDHLLPNTLGRGIWIQIQVAPNTTLSFSAIAYLESLGFTQAQVKGGGVKQRFHLPNPFLWETITLSTQERKFLMPSSPELPVGFLQDRQRQPHF
jgi:hypothetical protein